jgi:hypothetical protein
LRKLNLPIPVIHEILQSESPNTAAEVLRSYAAQVGKDHTHQAAATIVMGKMINMFGENKTVESVCDYLETVPENETEVLKEAIRIITVEPVKEIELAELLKDDKFRYSDLSLEIITQSEIGEMEKFIADCFTDIENGKKAAKQFKYDKSLDMAECLYNYKVIRENAIVGVVQLEYMGRDSMCIKYLAVSDSEIHIPLYQALRIKHPEGMYWNIRNRPGEPEHPGYDFEEHRQRFWEDNGFDFYTGHGHLNYSNWRKLKYTPSTPNLIQHNSLVKLTYRSVGIPETDIYDANLSGCRITDTNFSGSIIYDTSLDKIRVIDSGIRGGEFTYVKFDRTKIRNSSLLDVTMENCDIQGLTIDGVNVEEALEYYKDKKSK